MADPWRSGGTSTRPSSSPWRSKSSGSTKAAPPKKKGGSFFGFVGNIGEGLKDLAVASGPGLVELGKFIASTPGTAGGTRRADKNEQLLRAVARDYRQRYGPLARGDVSEFAHQLYEKPVPFALDATILASFGAGTAARGAAVAKAARSGGSVGKALRHGAPPELRYVKLPDAEAKALLGTYSRSALTRSTQKWLDGIRQRFPDAPIMGRSLYRKVGFQQRRLGDIEERLGRIGAEELLSVAGGRKLSASQHRALRIVAEGVPIDQRMVKHRADLAVATSTKQARKLRGEIRLLEQTKKHLDDAGGLKDPTLQRVYELAKDSTKRREDLLALVDELAPERASARVQKPAQLFGAEGAIGESFFTYSSRKRPTAFSRLGAARTIRHPQKPGTSKEFTGKAIEQGRIPHQEAILAAESELEAWRFTTILRHRDRLEQFGKPLPTRGDDVALVLDELRGKTLPEEVRALLGKAASGEVLAEEQLTVLARIGDGLRQQIFPGKWDDLQHLEQFRAAVDTPVPGVLWIDKRLLGGIEAVNPLVGFSGSATGRAALATVDTINNASRLAILYLMPLKYITPNALSQVAFALIQQGFAAPANLARAARLNAKLGRKAQLAVDAGMGEGFSVSIAGRGGGALGKVNSALGRWYGKIIDTPFRRAAFLHEAHRSGFTSGAEINKLLFDPALRDQRLATFMEANSEIIDYARLGRWERNVIRRVIFFYPWMKGATVYGGRFLIEHPGKAWALDQFGKIGAQAQSEVLGDKLPSYAEALAPWGTSGGLPTTLNLTSVSPFTTPYQMLRAAMGDPRSAYSLGSQFSPAVTAAIMATGFTPPGGYQSGPGAALRELYQGLPIYRYPKRMIEGPPERTVYPTTTWEDLFSLLLGPGVTPRRTDPPRLRDQAQQGR